MWGVRPPAALRTGKPVEDMKDLGRQRFEGRSDTLSGRPGPAVLLSISWRPPLLLEETPVSWRRRGVWRSQMALVDLPEALLPNEDDDCRTWLMSWTPTVLSGDLEALPGSVCAASWCWYVRCRHSVGSRSGSKKGLIKFSPLAPTLARVAANGPLP